MDKGVTVLRRLAAGLVTAIAGLSVATAQERPVSRYEEELEVREVLLDVVVTDGRGSVIVGLGEDDFIVEEDGEPVEIQAVSFYSNRMFRGGLRAPAAARGAGADEPSERFFILLFYRPPVGAVRSFELLARLPEAGRQAYEWVVGDLVPTDLVAVVGFDTTLRLVHDFSHDRQRLGRAIGQAATGRVPARRWPSRTESPIAGVSLGALAGDPLVKRRATNLFDAVRLLAAALGEISGRKILVMFGPDFPSLGSSRAHLAYRSMVEALNDHNVAVYSLDVDGRGRRPTPGRLARDTGGDYLLSSPDFRAPLQEIQRHNSGYYLLSYSSRHPAGERGYQKVAVRTVNPDFEVRTRSGYRYGG